MCRLQEYSLDVGEHVIQLVYATGMWPSEWFICFRRSSTYWWAEALAFGRYKHVSCFGYVPAVDGWLFYDFGVNSAAVAVVPERHADGFIGRAQDDALVVKYVPPVAVTGIRIKPAFLCTSAVAHMTGVRSCALRPDRFLRDCLAAGAELVIADDDEFRKLHEGRPGPRTGEGCRAY